MIAFLRYNQEHFFFPQKLHKSDLLTTLRITNKRRPLMEAPYRKPCNFYNPGWRVHFTSCSMPSQWPGAFYYKVLAFPFSKSFWIYKDKLLTESKQFFIWSRPGSKSIFGWLAFNTFTSTHMRYNKFVCVH